MNQISLYLIIALLLLQGFTGYQYFTTKQKLTETTASLEKCTDANKETNTSLDIENTVNDANQELCKDQQEDKSENEEQLRKDLSDLNNLYNTAAEKAKGLEAKNKSLAAENRRLKDEQKQQPEITDEEAKEIVDYLNTLVPAAIEREQLHRVRGKNKDSH